MNANPKFASADAHVDAAAVQPLPNSSKIYVTGSRDDLRVPMRAVSQADTPTGFGGEKNPPVYVYDTSGPYTDPEANIDIRSGLPALRARWIAERADTEQLADLSSAFGRERDADPATAGLRFPNLQRHPLRASPGRNVSQMHYARQGIVTPEMEFVAIRENQLRAEYLEGLRTSGPQGAKLADLMGRQHPVGIFLSAVLFGALIQGGFDLSLEKPNIPTETFIFIQGLIILFCGAMENFYAPAISAMLKRRKG